MKACHSDPFAGGKVAPGGFRRYFTADYRGEGRPSLEKIDITHRSTICWRKLPVPGLPAPIDKKLLRFQFDLDLIDLNLKPNDQAILKLVAFDRKGSTGESEPIQLSIISRDLDLSAANDQAQKHGIQGITKLAESADSRTKATAELVR